jgi:hypothetical protein
LNDNGYQGKVSIRYEKYFKSTRDWFRVFRDIKPDVVGLVYGMGHASRIRVPKEFVIDAKMSEIERLMSYQKEHKLRLTNVL